MFDPELWRQTKLSVICLLVIGGILLLPAGYVFFLAFVVLDSGLLGMLGSTDDTILFWSALIGSCTGVLAWMSLCLLLFQRRDVRFHRLAWHLVRLSGITIILCLLVWFGVLFTSHGFSLGRSDILIFQLVLGVIFAAAVLLVWLSHRNLRRTRASAKRLAAAK